MLTHKKYERISDIYSNVDKKVLLTEKYRQGLKLKVNSESSCYSGFNYNYLEYFYYQIKDKYGNEKIIYLTEVNSYFKQVKIEWYNKIIKFCDNITKDLKTIEIETSLGCSKEKNVYYYKKYKKNNHTYKKYYFIHEKRSDCFLVDKKDIWDIFRGEFNLSYIETQDLLRSLINNKFKLSIFDVYYTSKFFFD